MTTAATATTARLAGPAQALIDCRLDTIDRMLLGRVSRSERLAIVAEVESQIFERLAERGADDPGREDVLEVLARLDPPEAYLAEPGEHLAADAPRAPRPAPVRGPAAAPPADLRLARAGGILGIVALVLVPLFPTLFLLAEVIDSVPLIVTLLCGNVGLILLCGVLAVVLAGYTRLRGAWSVAGLVTGLIATVFGLIGAVGLMLELLG